MTQLGHALTGISLGILGLKPNLRRRAIIGRLAVFALLANIPDIEVRGWGHYRYNVSHSVVVTSALIILAIIAFKVVERLLNRKLDWWLITFGSLAWLSHLLLDTFYNHGRGIGLFWPISDAHVALPMPWFEVIQVIPPPITAQLLREFAVETIFYGAFVLLAIIIVKRRHAHSEKMTSK